MCWGVCRTCWILEHPCWMCWGGSLECLRTPCGGNTQCLQAHAGPRPKLAPPPSFGVGLAMAAGNPGGGGLHGGTPFGPAWLTLSIHFLTRPGHGASKNLDCPHTGQAPIFAIWMAARCSSVAGFDSPPLGPARPPSISGN